ncbi:hypothetical protein ZWY2020_032170 [Hordeum vulgare]|nr:hypothetical protein ZWY2020_032170 [Hordeum vulgare]
MFNFAHKVVACIADTCTCYKLAGRKQCVLKTQAMDVPETQDLVDLNYQTPVRRRTTGPTDNISGCGGQEPLMHEMVVVLMRRLGQIDKSFSTEPVVMRWRKFLDPDFATAVLSNADPVYVQSIQKMFFTGIDEANPASCRMWHITAILEDGWALYSFDMVKKKVIVLDPAVGPFGYSNRRVKMHTYVSNKLHAALFRCINQFYSSWICSPGGWSRAFPILMNEKVARHELGLCTVFFAKNYDGDKLVIPLTRENLKIHKKIMLFELMRLEGNDSLLPQDALQAIKNSFCIL